MKTCLVLEGGALRGIYTAGVLDELIKDNIAIDTIIGVSMGALVGINYVSNQPGRAIRYNLEYCNDKRYMGMSSYLKTGDIVNKKFAYYELPNKLDKFDYETFNKSKINFYCTITNVKTGKPEYIKINDSYKDIEYLRAGGSMPGVSKIVKINGNKYLDGGIADSIPIDKALSMNFDKIIVVTTRTINYRKKESSINPLSFMYYMYPNFVKTLNTRAKRYNKTVEKIIDLEKQNKIFVIRPSIEVPIKRIEKDKKMIEEQYNLGIKDYKSIRKDLLDYLNRR